ncbi:hypothetical protein LSH36_60g08013, partial [Paralvinella palmiformis]
MGKCTDKFVLSVTIAFATNLPQLVPTTIPLPPTGFFFYYTLFGNDVTNEVFHDLLAPSFPAERASVRLRSSVEALQQFFASQPGLQIHLCCGDQSLGNSEIHLKDLLKPGSTEIYMKPVSIEGAFQLHPPNRLKQMIPAVPEDQRPLVGVSIILRKEDMVGLTLKLDLLVLIFNITAVASSPKRDSPSGKKSDLPPPGGPPAETGKHPSPKSSPKHKAIPQKKEKHKATKPRQALTPPSSPPPPAPPTPHDGSYTETFESGSKSDTNVASLGEEVRKAAIQAEQQEEAGEAAASSAQPADIQTETESLQPQSGARTEPTVTEDSNSTTQHHIVVPPQAHHYTFSIDLRSISHLQVPHHANVFLRYTYPFFGSATPIMTNPPVEVRKGMEVLLPQSYCAFDFATTPQQLLDTLTRVPLYVEVWDRDHDKSQNVLLGAAQVNLNNVLQSERAKAVVWSHKVAAQAADNLSSDSTVADVAVVLTLEDWGAITQKVTVPGENSQLTSDQVKPLDVRETPEYKAALELEMWKEQQESLFESQLKEKEAQYMRVLAEEWKRRDKEREMVVKKKLSEYNQLEQQLRKSLTDLEKREKQLAANEQEVLRLRKDLQREHEWKMTEMRDASRRLKEDCDFRIELERKKVVHLEDTVQKLKSQLAEAEAKTVELERKVEALTKSKIHYKQQWGRALKELARIKQKEQAIAQAHLRKQQQELEHMRLRYLAAEEKEVVKSEQKELEEIKNELNQITLLGSGKPLYTTETENTEEDHIGRLIEERDTLLRTGVYTNDDRIISELDRQIREAIARKG